MGPYVQCMIPSTCGCGSISEAAGIAKEVMQAPGAQSERKGRYMMRTFTAGEGTMNHLLLGTH